MSEKLELIFMGPPASGKGTQTKLLEKELNLPHVDTGSMLRAAIASGSDAGMTAKSYMDRGQLVPIDIVATIIKERLSQDDCSKGFILDGYPRSVEQAEVLEDIFAEINAGQDAKVKVINVGVDENLLIERIVNRRSCKCCGKIYNLKFFPPQKSDECDDCSGELMQRTDDTKETAMKRLQTYKTQTQPLIEFYADKGLLHSVDGNKEMMEVFADIKKVIG